MQNKRFTLKNNSLIKPFRKIIKVDSDKSLSIRSFIIGSISQDISKVKNVDKQTEDWQILPSVFNYDNKRYGPFFVNVFSTEDNKITEEYVNDFDAHGPYVGDAFVFHPPYQPDIVERMVAKQAA